MDGDVLRAAHELMRQGPPQQFAEEAAVRAANDDLGDVLELGEAQQLGRQVGAGERLRFGAEAFGELHRLIQPLAGGRIEVGPRPFDRDGHPGRIHQVGKTLGGAHHGRRNRVGADAGQDAFARRPWPFDGLRLHALDQRGIDPFGRAPQRELAQSGQVLRLEKVLDRARRGVLDIDLALGEAL